MSLTKQIGHYLSLVKFSHTVFALPFAIIGFMLGANNGWLLDSLLGRGFSVKEWLLIVGALFLKVILCMVFARNAAMGFNRYLDRDIDAKNERTALREVPAGIISSQHALWFVIINCLLFIGTTFFINPICFYLSPVALFVILFYSYTKRFTPLCHLVLGLGLSLAPIGAYLAVTGTFDMIPLFFSAMVFTWVSGFDIMYALQDEDFDRENGLYSIPVLLGKKNALLASRILHLITAVLIIVAGYQGLFDNLYWVGALLFISLLVYQHTLVKPNDISKIDLAFGKTNGIASIVFALFVIADILYTSSVLFNGVEWVQEVFE
jgi:4-hydroxybenzoate polyprenyltransferase